MEKIKILAKNLITECEKFTVQTGRLTNVFKNIAMQEIKSIELKIIEHTEANTSYHVLTPLLSERNYFVRERGGYVIGELLKRNKFDTDAKKEILNALQRALGNESLIVPDSVLREFVNAIGKSGDSSKEKILLDLLDSKESKRIRMFILVAIGKTGTSNAIKVLLNFTQRRDLRISDIMSVVWTFGKLAGTSRESIPIIPRSNFKDVIPFLQGIIKSSALHEQIYTYCIFAIGEIGDQRDIKRFPDNISVKNLTEFKELLLVFKRKVENGKFKNKIPLLNIISTVTKMLQGESLSIEQERILFEIRNLLDINFENITGVTQKFTVNDESANIIETISDDITVDYMNSKNENYEKIENKDDKEGVENRKNLLPKSTPKFNNDKPNSIRDFFN